LCRNARDRTAAEFGSGVARQVGTSTHAGSASLGGRAGNPGFLAARGAIARRLRELSLRSAAGTRTKDSGALIAFRSLVLEVFSVMAKNSANLGVVGGKLRPCPDTPNCVCSMDPAAAYHVEPLVFPGDPDEALSRLKDVLANQTRTRLVAEEADYLHAECSSLLFRFVDDLEFSLDRLEKKIHVRSASRTGKYDFGVNRRRVEAIRRAFETHP
jgi:uncharacterized protein (DUF1499 family)